MSADHARLALLAAQFGECVHAVLTERSITRETVVEAGQTFIAATRSHIDMEESAYFPYAEKTLSEDDWRAVACGGEAEGDPLFGPTRDRRFAALFVEIAQLSGKA